MITPEERLLIGLNALERIKPSRRNRRLQAALPYVPDHETREMALAAPLVKAPAAALPASAAYAPSLQMLLAQVGPLYPYAALLGACEDGLPFLLDLTNPAPGALLIIADSAGGKTRLIRSVLASIVQLNTPEQVAYGIVSPDRGEYLDLAQAPHCQAVLNPDDSASGELLEALALFAQQQIQGNGQGPVIVLAIDDLARCLQSLDERSLAYLYWLIQNGCYGRVWVIASLPCRQSDLIGSEIMQAFGTRLIGNIREPQLAAYLAGDFNSGVELLAAGYEFCVFFGNEWIRFWICDAD